MVKIICTLFFLLLFFRGNSQETTTYKIFYHLKNIGYVTEQKFDSIQKSIVETIPFGQLFSYTGRAKIQNDSIIIPTFLKGFKITPRFMTGKDNVLELLNKPFPFIKFKDIEGNIITKDSLIGKPTVVNLWFTRCKPCVGEIPLLNILQEKYKNKANFIALTFDEKFLIKSFVKKNKFNFKHIIVGDNYLKNSLHTNSYPTTFFLDKNGNIKYIEMMAMEHKVYENLNSFEFILESLLED